jgi:hypothetical protein
MPSVSQQLTKFLLNSFCTHDMFRPLLGHHQVNLQNIKKEALFIQRIRRVVYVKYEMF